MGYGLAVTSWENIVNMKDFSNMTRNECDWDLPIEDFSDIEQKYWVKIFGGEWVDVDKTEFIDIEEDPSGRDVMTFEYEGVTYSSAVMAGSRPG